MIYLKSSLIYLAFLLGLISQGAFPCNSQADSKTSPMFKLGVTVPLTGDFASYGKLIQDGVELAREDLEKEGYVVKVFYEDVCFPADAVGAINKLISANQIDALAANFCVIAVPPMAKIIERNKVIAFHTASASDSILDAGDYIFTTNIKVQNEAKHLAEYAFNELKAKTVSILYITTDFGEDYNTHFKNRFEELGGKVLSSDTSPMGVNDFRTELLRVKSKNPDVIFAAHLGLTLGVLLKQARETGLKQQILGVYEAQDPSILEIAGKAAEGLQFFVPEPTSITENVRIFQSKFLKKYSYLPRILASNAYDATMVIVSSLAKCKKDSECAKKEIYNIRDYDGVSGRFSISQDGGTEKGFVLKTVKDGKFVKLN